MLFFGGFWSRADFGGCLNLDLSRKVNLTHFNTDLCNDHYFLSFLCIPSKSETPGFSIVINLIRHAKRDYEEGAWEEGVGASTAEAN